MLEKEDDVGCRRQGKWDLQMSCERSERERGEK